MSVTAALCRVVADTLLPGDEVWPSGSAVGVDQSIAGSGTALASLLGPDFVTADVDQREMLLRSAEQADPTLVGRVVEGAYTAYYTCAPVAAFLEAHHGYPQRPPQPDGYAMEPFDESVLHVVRQRAQLFRVVELSGP